MVVGRYSAADAGDASVEHDRHLDDALGPER